MRSVRKYEPVLVLGICMIMERSSVRLDSDALSALAWIMSFGLIAAQNNDNHNGNNNKQYPLCAHIIIVIIIIICSINCAYTSPRVYIYGLWD